SIQIPSGIKSDVYSLSSSYMGYKDEYGNFEIQVYADRDTGYKDYSVSILSIKRKSTNDIVIPETINGFPVKKLNQVHDYPLKQAEDNFSISNIFEVNSIEFPKYLNDISTAAFKNRTKLTKIIINSPDIKIADNAFANTGIEELNLHGSCNIGKNAFADCKNLKSITIDGNPETVEIGNQAFQNCTSLEKIIIPDTCKNTIIGRNAFKNTGIKQLEINSNCTIGIDAFSGCPMESVIINSENAEISLDAFADCENLRELKLSKGCKLSQNAFMNHTALENINIDISGSITGSAFNGCENLTSINGEQVFDENTGDFIPKYKDFIMNNFNLADDIGFINQYVKSQVKKIVSENITPDMNDMQKIRTLHDWVCANTSYSPAGQESHNDAAILMNDTTVCEGYSRMCNLLYHEAGLETYYVTGVNHAWNIVNIDGHYFHVDSTWDDSNDEINYKWFCKSDSEMKNAGGYHASWKTAVISSIHDFQENISPECNYQIGDMNTDNEINIADMVKLEKYILNAEKPDNNLVLSDLNFDGITDVFDVIEMRRKITE
ncbi:MAG: leucine-rich repeat protein, partial [Ruminococcus sp.]|nr:leucine-rich repeat protein [Ruminococcus sp.]